MKHLVIRHFGPIIEADVELKRINLVIGPQSSGKSCVLKIASFCDWVERQIMQTQDVKYAFSPNIVEQNLILFHKLVDYMRPDSYFSYETDFMYFEYSEKKKHCGFKWKTEAIWDYKSPKIAYIPAERNLVAAIPNWFQVSMHNDNILDFMKEWEFARRVCVRSKDILNLGVKYKYLKLQGIDRIVLENGTELAFNMTSSGLQSLIPLYVMVSYLTSEYFKRITTSVQLTIFNIGLTRLIDEKFPDLSEDQRAAAVTSILTPQRTDLYIEEPEAHIFPSTQKDFVYALAGMLYNGGLKKHSCFITTHSPYIMTSFNNLIFAGEIAAGSKERAARTGELIPRQQWLRLDEVGAFEMREGGMYPIVDEEAGLISARALDSASDEIGRDFDNLLNIV